MADSSVPSAVEKLRADLRKAQARIAELEALINNAEIDGFLRGTHIEAVHQVERWGTAHDRARRPADWFWLVGYLAGKALHSQTNEAADVLAEGMALIREDAPPDDPMEPFAYDARAEEWAKRADKVIGSSREKALHHCISTAAALYNWHCAIKGVDVRMCPGRSDIAQVVDGAFPSESDDG